MKRSEINRLIADAETMFARYGFRLPPFAFWSPEEYRKNAADCAEIRECQLGWDVTDFGFGDFRKDGLLLFTIRNGIAGSAVYRKPYAEKIMVVRVGQTTPLHYHNAKTEDIINRGGGRLVFRFYRSVPGTCELDTASPVAIRGDGRIREIPAGGETAIGPGESLTLEPGVFHSFWAEDAPCMVGEVSAVNDDHTDNVFHTPQRRFPEIEEDEAPRHLLVGDYDRWSR